MSTTPSSSPAFRTTLKTLVHCSRHAEPCCRRRRKEKERAKAKERAKEEKAEKEEMAASQERVAAKVDRRENRLPVGALFAKASTGPRSAPTTP